MSDKKMIISTVGTLAALSFSLGTFASEREQINPFEAEELHNGFMVAEAGQDKPQLVEIIRQQMHFPPGLNL